MIKQIYHVSLFLLVFSITLAIGMCTHDAQAHGKHKIDGGWQDHYKVLHMLHMGDSDPALDSIHAFYIDTNQDCLTDRVILRALASEHGTHIVYDDSYEKFLIDFGRYWAVEDKPCNV